MPYADPARKRENNKQWVVANRDRIRELRRANRDAINARKRAGYARRRDDLNAARRQDPLAHDARWVKSLWRKHGMRPADWSAIWANQEGLCYLCAQPLGAPGHAVHIDHDHSCCPAARSCGYCRRGLACGKCNVAIAMADDDPARLRILADRLEVTKRDAAERIGRRPAALQLWDDVG